MKFNYYITDLFKGQVVGTNDESNARNCAGCDEFFVVDVSRGVQIGSTEALDQDVPPTRAG